MQNAAAAALPSAVIAILLVFLHKENEEFRDHVSIEKMKASQLWAALIATLSLLISFRTNKAYARFWDGTTLLHQMWGEWFDAVSCLVAFSTMARKNKPEEVQEFRHTLIRLMSLCHGSAMEEIAQATDGPEGYPAVDIGGLDQRTLRYLRDCKFDQRLNFNRVEVLIHMIQTLIVNNHESGVLKIPPPILSRVFQTISRGQVNLANCKKITHTLFPFPYAQLIAALLVTVAAMTPFAMAAICEEAHWAFMFTIVPVFGLFALNYVARELEMPFGTDHNDLPLPEFQDHMNNSLLMLIREETDLVPKIDKSSITMDWDRIKEKISTARPKDFIKAEEEILIENKASFTMEKAPPPPAPAPAPAPAPPPAAAAPPIMETKMTALEQALEKSMAEFSDRFNDLKESTGSLASQLGQNNEVMVQFSRDVRDLLTKSQMAQMSAMSALTAQPSQMQRPIATLPTGTGNGNGNGMGMQMYSPMTPQRASSLVPCCDVYVPPNR